MSFEEVAISTGLKHGAFYLPRDAWLAPLREWIAKGDAQQTQAGAAAAASFSIERSRVRTLHSNLLGRDYEIYIQLPATYEAGGNRRYPLVLLNDAPYAFPLASGILRPLASTGRTDELILVGVAYSRGDDGGLSRTRDYTPTRSVNEPNGHSAAARRASGEARAYLRFLTEELLPWLGREHRADLSRKMLVATPSEGSSAPMCCCRRRPPSSTT
jgi:enterochelin esterase-like enzyme